MEENGLHPYSVREAAQVLGISSRGVRFRMESGKLRGTQIDGKWMVFLPSPKGRKVTEEGSSAPSDYVVEGSSTEEHAEEALPPPRQPAQRPPEQMQLIMNEWLAPLTAKISDQAEEIGKLKERLAQKEQEAQVLAEALDSISQIEPDETSHGFWARWFGFR